jgi:glycosyltransferase involved in cell wall biosynthesis
VTALFDAQGIQSRSFRERGVARYITELAEAMERWFPEAVASYLINPSLPVASAIESLPDPARIGTVDDVPPDADVYHVGSPFEPDVQLDLLWPPAARPLRLVVTLYDLIPQLFPDIYLTDPPMRAWYRTRLNLIRRADRVLAISRATGADAVEQLGIPADRVVVVGAAAADRFLPPPNREAALEALRALHPEIEPDFLLYTGGIEPRKNIDRLLAAYAGMSERLRRAHQLVIVCRILPDQRATLEARLRELGIAGRVHFTDYVSDEELTLLYGTTTLFVFPSLYEGFGLPIAEAMACGAPVISSESSSLPELVLDADARFDPYDSRSIQSSMERFLSDRSRLDALRQQSLGDRASWWEVAARTAAVYEELSGQRRPQRVRRRPRVAYVSPLPPQRSGVADYSYRLVEALSGHCDVDAFVDTLLGDQRAPPGVRVAAISHFDVVERLRGGYDRIFICLGNSEHHMASLALLRRRGGVVLAHDVRLTGLYGSIPHHRPELDRRPLAQMLTEMYDAALPEETLQTGVLDPSVIHAHSIFMAREAIRAADRFMVHSQYAAHLARSDAAPHDRHKVGVAPFAFPSPGEFEPPAEANTEFVIGTFGVVAPVKQTEKVLEAFAVVASARADAVLRVAGPPAGPGDYDRLRARAAELGLLDRVQLLGHVDGESFCRLVAGTTIAVQLRAISMGESPASVGDCLAAGVPTVVSAVGAARELPDEAVVKVRPDVGADALGRMLLALADDEPKRAALRAAGQALASERSFEHVARFVYERLVLSGASGAELAA